MSSSVPARAERMVRLRAVAAVTLGTILIATQGQRMDDGGGGPLNWALWGTIVAAFLVWGSGLFSGRSIRILLNDESSELHRRRALTIGFWVMLADAAVCYLLTFVKPYGPRDAIQLIITGGLSAAMISFAVWEFAALGPARGTRPRGD